MYDESTWRSSPSGVVCIGSPSDDFNESSPVEIDLTNTASYAAKTFIVYGKNIVLSGSMPQSSTIALNLFADRANVLLQHPSADVYFDKDGNLGDGTSGCTTGLTCTRGVYLRGNIFINGLLFGESGTAISHKVFVHGKFASLNTGLEPTTERKTQIQSLFDNSYTSFGSSINSTYCAGVNCINFNNVFNRECELSGLGNDGVVCNIPGDRFKYNPFIVIDTTIPTTLLQ